MSQGIGFFADEACRGKIVSRRNVEMDALKQIVAEGGSVGGLNIGPLQLLRISASDMLAQALN
ncbi:MULTISPECIES: hypothetical protein [Pseudomonas]|uniref:hypothetical protein n=1 Tax=Pseudomonas TaxID=286 RepID=UPI000B356D0F|nr:MULTISPECIES: hypothetical protein [Pseudomonas]PMY68953.1 hypothetical protein C1Y31_06165 [Pseudomonas sp. FW305-25]PMY73019.1 hypothetical protein C1Y32_08940 [Pseudomonas sp. FW126-L8]PNA82913.1 hypothetical protein C1Y33_02385 [Pseudomonas sp. FW305-76]